MKGLFYTQDLMFSSRVLAAARTLGKTLEIAASPERLREACQTGDVSLVLLDLNAAESQLASLVPDILAHSPNAHLVAFGPHVDDQRLAQAVAAGCHSVLTRGQFVQSYTSLLQSHL